VRSGSRHLSSRRVRGQRGFTLLELVIAMVFVALLASGISLSLATCLNVWRRSLATADLNQEARAVMETLCRDLRGTYLGLARGAGYFVGTPPDPAGPAVATLELCTESTSAERLSLLPEEVLNDRNQESAPPVTDYVGVRYELREETEESPAGLYRTTVVAPVADRGLIDQEGLSEVNSEMISRRVIALNLRYLDGQQWVTTWDTMLVQRRRAPGAVSIRLVLRDERHRDHVFQTIVAAAAG
jgi:prepilin-type N-terminal cleavage/methylation domain-containing protein